MGVRGMAATVVAGATLTVAMMATVAAGATPASAPPAASAPRRRERHDAVRGAVPGAPAQPDRAPRDARGLPAAAAGQRVAAAVRQLRGPGHERPRLGGAAHGVRPAHGERRERLGGLRHPGGDGRAAQGPRYVLRERPRARLRRPPPTRAMAASASWSTPRPPPRPATGCGCCMSFRAAPPLAAGIAPRDLILEVAGDACPRPDLVRGPVDSDVSLLDPVTRPGAPDGRGQSSADRTELRQRTPRVSAMPQRSGTCGCCRWRARECRRT